ncbi:hypothetical protein LINGRAHAP2_LOCUS21406, partial [Linum grandiflorum]
PFYERNLEKRLFFFKVVTNGSTLFANNKVLKAGRLTGPRCWSNCIWRRLPMAVRHVIIGRQPLSSIAPEVRRCI